MYLNNELQRWNISYIYILSLLIKISNIEQVKECVILSGRYNFILQKKSLKLRYNTYTTGTVWVLIRETQDACNKGKHDF